MSDQISISTATQGTSTAATKPQAGGKGSGFLGMLMAAIGHKPTADTGMQATAAKTADGKHQGKTTLLAMAGDAAAQGAKATKSGHGKSASLTDAIAKATDGKHQGAATLLAVAGDAAAQGAKATKSDHGKSVLTDATAKATNTKHQQTTALLGMAEGDVTTHGKTAKHAKAKGGHADMTKHHDAKSQQRQSDAQANGMSGTAATTTSPASMAQAAAVMAPVQPSQHRDAQAAASAVETHAQAQGDASIPMEGLTGHAAPAAAASTKMQAKLGKPAAPGASQPSLPQAASDAGHGKATVEAAKAAASAAGQAASASAKPAQDAAITAQSTAQPAEEIAAAGMQAEGRQNGMRNPSKASPHADTGAMAAAGKASKAGQGAMNMTATQTQGHPQDAMAANSHAGVSDTPGITTTRSPLSQAGLQSYSQAAGEHARQLPLQATLTPRADQAAGLRHDLPAGSASTAVQDPTAGNMAMTASAGIGAHTQAMATPQTAMPQAPVHASGPWTAMAAMTEIGQAAANGQTRLELKLEPAHLGKVHVRIDSDSRKNIQVHLVVEQPNSRQIIEQQLPNLRHALEQQGLNLGNFSMSSQQQGGGQGSGQPQPQATAAVSTPGFSTTPVSAPQVLPAPSETPGAGRLSIRI